MAKQTFTALQVLTAAQMTALQANDYNQTVSTKTASYTLVAADVGTKIVMNAGATSTTITVNTSLFAAGDTLQILNTSTSGTCTVTAGTATVASAGSLALGLNQGGTLYFTSTGVSVFQADGVAATAASVAIFNETQSSGTNGGTATSGSYVKRTLNTTIQNGITGCSIASSVITLAAGTYQVTARAPVFDVTTNSSRLQNTTDASTTQQGSSNYASSSNYGFSFIDAYFTITGTKNFEVQTKVGLTVSTNGYGAGTAMGSEIYTEITITKVA